ncbi:hypothetical protein DFJ77DRAFT_515806 [Powellomyces hirtus]|nr:hypothetical protein DFJ77DRAFT_515806 [Powellomyces hirtus]
MRSLKRFERTHWVAAPSGALGPVGPAGGTLLTPDGSRDQRRPAAPLPAKTDLSG